MKSTLVAFAIAALVAFSGCDKGKVGGEGGKDKKAQKVGTAENSFTLAPPSTSTTLIQGETKEVTISIKRGKDFDQDVPLKFSDVPDGVTFDPAAPTIKKSEKDVSVKVSASDKAAINDFVIKITGKPEKGDAAENTMKLTVKKKS